MFLLAKIKQLTNQLFDFELCFIL